MPVAHAHEVQIEKNAVYADDRHRMDGPGHEKKTGVAIENANRDPIFRDHASSATAFVIGSGAADGRVFAPRASPHAARRDGISQMRQSDPLCLTGTRSVYASPNSKPYTSALRKWILNLTLPGILLTESPADHLTR